MWTQPNDTNLEWRVLFINAHYDMVPQRCKTMDAVHYQKVTKQPKHGFLGWPQHAKKAKDTFIKADGDVKAIFFFLELCQETKESTDTLTKANTIQNTTNTKRASQILLC